MEITDEKAPVYSNREEDTNELSLDDLNPEKSKDIVGNAKNIWLIVAVFAVTAVTANIILVLVFKRKKKV